MLQVQSLYSEFSKFFKEDFFTGTIAFVSSDNQGHFLLAMMPAEKAMMVQRIKIKTVFSNLMYILA